MRKGSLRRKKGMLFKNESAKFCKYCNTLLEFDIATVDHIIARSKGGSDKIENLAVSCLDCNQKKDNT